MKSGISRDKTKFIRTKENGAGDGPADTCLKQDRTRCRRGRVSRIETVGPLLTPLQTPREYTNSSARAEQRTTGIYIRVPATTLYPREPVTCEGKERHERELLTRSVRPYTKCTISPCSVSSYQKIKEKSDDGIESHHRGYYMYKVKRNVL